MDGAATVLSENEIRFFLTRAAAGSGAPFGIAEDFAGACLWLASLAADPARLALAALSGLEGETANDPVALSETTETLLLEGKPGMAVSAIMAGPAAADLLAVEDVRGNGRQIVIGNVDQPVLVAAVIGSAWTSTRDIVIEWASHDGPRCISLGGASIAFACGRELEPAGQPAKMTIRFAEPLREQAAATPLPAGDWADRHHRMAENGIAVDATAWKGVMRHFHKYLVPSSDQSRMEGAGAGLSDND